MKYRNILLVVAAAGLPLHHAGAAETASPRRLEEVAERGRHVMPFSLERTQHIFTKTDRGGVQQVIVKNPADREQIELIRRHLTEISEAFGRGDFSGPAQIHGESMPGLAELRSAMPGEIDVRYRALSIGGEITYASESPDLVEAVHRWFDAQLRDHGPHAVPELHHEGMRRHHEMHGKP